MNETDRLLANWAAASGLLCVVLCFIAGFIDGNHLAWWLAVADCGAIYLSYSIQLLWPQKRELCGGAAGLTVVIGILAVFSLLR